MTSNYGLATEFTDSYSAGIYGGKTDLQTINFNLSGAYRLNNNWSFGLGFDAVYAKAKLSATPVRWDHCCLKVDCRGGARFVNQWY